jgi:hypothetical protein
MKRLGRLQNHRNTAAQCLLGLSLIVLLVGIGASPVRAQAAAETAAATASSGATASSSAAVLPKKDKSVASPHLPASSGPPAEVANRQNFEEHAGTTPGKLMLRSSPTDAKIFINGLYVGHAPLLLLLAPGKYKVEMRGSRQEFGHRTIVVAPDETREAAFSLAPLYPFKVSTQ